MFCSIKFITLVYFFWIHLFFIYKQDALTVFTQTLFGKCSFSQRVGFLCNCLVIAANTLIHPCPL